MTINTASIICVCVCVRVGERMNDCGNNIIKATLRQTHSVSNKMERKENVRRSILKEKNRHSAHMTNATSMREQMVTF